jgi:hypothetical protein
VCVGVPFALVLVLICIISARYYPSLCVSRSCLRVASVSLSGSGSGSGSGPVSVSLSLCLCLCLSVCLPWAYLSDCISRSRADLIKTSQGVMVVGLHTCGDLAASVLRSFQASHVYQV